MFILKLQTFMCSISPRLFPADQLQIKVYPQNNWVRRLHKNAIKLMPLGYTDTHNLLINFYVRRQHTVVKAGKSNLYLKVTFLFLFVSFLFLANCV